MLNVGETYYFEDGWSFVVKLAEGKGSLQGTDYPYYTNEDGSVRLLGWDDDEIVVTDEYKIQHKYCMTREENEIYQGHYNSRRFGEHKFDDGKPRKNQRTEVEAPEDIHDPNRGVASDDEMYDSGSGGVGTE